MRRWPREAWRCVMCASCVGGAFALASWRPPDVVCDRESGLYICESGLYNIGRVTHTLISTGSHIPLAIPIARHRSSIAHNVRYIAIATWEDWIVGRGAEGMIQTVLVLSLRPTSSVKNFPVRRVRGRWLPWQHGWGSRAQATCMSRSSSCAHQRRRSGSC